MTTYFPGWITATENLICTFHRPARHTTGNASGAFFFGVPVPAALTRVLVSRAPRLSRTFELRSRYRLTLGPLRIGTMTCSANRKRNGVTCHAPITLRDQQVPTQATGPHQHLCLLMALRHFCAADRSSTSPARRVMRIKLNMELARSIVFLRQIPYDFVVLSGLVCTSGKGWCCVLLYATQ